MYEEDQGNQFFSWSYAESRIFLAFFVLCKKVLSMSQFTLLACVFYHHNSRCVAGCSSLHHSTCPGLWFDRWIFPSSHFFLRKTPSFQRCKTTSYDQDVPLECRTNMFSASRHGPWPAGDGCSAAHCGGRGWNISQEFVGFSQSSI